MVLNYMKFLWVVLTCTIQQVKETRKSSSNIFIQTVMLLFMHHFLEVEPLDKQGYVNVKDYSENEIRVLLLEAKEFMDSDEDGYKEGLTKIYQDNSGEKLSLVYENKMWVIYTGENLEAVFPTLESAEGICLMKVSLKLN